ncbi:MAG: hypothetical protein ACRCVU_11770 [Flavobacterium sp.]
MSPATFNLIMNSAEIDFEHFTIADAVSLAEFQEDVLSWEDIMKED